MSMNVSSVGSTSTSSSVSTSKTKVNNNQSSSKSTFDETAAVYEKSNVESTTTASTATASRDNSAIIEQLKADAEKRQNQLMEIVRKSLGAQGAAAFQAGTGLKSLFENIKVDEDTIAKAKADTAEDGYWGVEQTSNRILDFAKALAGNDSSKAEELLKAFKKGFDQATQAWGDKLPQLCQDTYDAVLDKFQKWIDGDE